MSNIQDVVNQSIQAPNSDRALVYQEPNDEELCDFVPDEVNAHISSLNDLNKPWSFIDAEGQTTNFDCTECIKIELAYLTYQHTQKEEHRTIDIAFYGSIGVIDFVTYLMTIWQSEGH